MLTRNTTIQCKQDGYLFTGSKCVRSEAVSLTVMTQVVNFVLLLARHIYISVVSMTSVTNPA